MAFRGEESVESGEKSTALRKNSLRKISQVATFMIWTLNGYG